MKVNYDKRTDTLSIILKENADVVESDEEKAGVILDYDDKGDFPCHRQEICRQNNIPDSKAKICCQGYNEQGMRESDFHKKQ